MSVGGRSGSDNVLMSATRRPTAVPRRIAVALVGSAMAAFSVAGCGGPELVTVDAVKATERSTDIVVTYMIGACDSAPHVDVAETAQRIKISVRVQHSDRDCITLGLVQNSHVALESPVGSRTIIDAATGQPVSARHG